MNVQADHKMSPRAPGCPVKHETLEVDMCLVDMSCLWYVIPILLTSKTVLDDMDPPRNVKGDGFRVEEEPP